jgi:hypothetical protein
MTQISEDNTSIQLPLKNMQIWTLKDGKVYFIIYSGAANQFFDSLEDAQKMIDSFKIIK